MGRFLLSTLIGIDMSMGILIYVVLSFIFRVEFSPYVLGFSILCSHLPDTDMALYLFCKKVLKIKLRSHQVFFHHLLIFTSTVGAIAWFGTEYLSLNQVYFTAMVVLGIMAHLSHDSHDSLGTFLLTPFSSRRYSWNGWRLKKVSEEFIDGFFKEKEKIVKLGDEFSWRTDPISLVSIIIFSASCILLLGFYLVR